MATKALPLPISCGLNEFDVKAEPREDRLKVRRAKRRGRRHLRPRKRRSVKL